MFVRNLRIAVFAASVVFLFPATHASAGGSATAKLEQFHTGLLERYPEVEHISSEQLRDATPEDFILFDVREDSEFNVSRIEGAIRVSPSASASDFLDAHAAKIKDRKVVLYCSVGERSSRLAEQLMSRAGESRPAAIYNLEGGIFKWHNEHKDVVASKGETSAIHPYNFWWGRLLERQDAIRTRPE